MYERTLESHPQSRTSWSSLGGWGFVTTWFIAYASFHVLFVKQMLKVLSENILQPGVYLYE